MARNLLQLHGSSALGGIYSIERTGHANDACVGTSEHSWHTLPYHSRKTFPIPLHKTK